MIIGNQRLGEVFGVGSWNMCLVYGWSEENQQVTDMNFPRNEHGNHFSESSAKNAILPASVYRVLSGHINIPAKSVCFHSHIHNNSGISTTELILHCS